MRLDQIYASSFARRAVEVALAGEHSIMFIGRWQSAGSDLAQYMKQVDEYAVAHFAPLCPCGFWGSPDHECTCQPEIARQWREDHFGEHTPYDMYLELSQERLDRVMDFLTGRMLVEPEEKMLARIEEMARHTDLSLDVGVEVLLKAGIEYYDMPARVAQRVVRVARTIANLAHSEKIHMAHMAEAIQYRPRRELHDHRRETERTGANSQGSSAFHRANEILEKTDGNTTG
jgi:predicted ATPase with chaperone activity